MTALDALYSSEYDDWNTPEPVLERVRRVDEIGLDPCSNAQSIVCARVEWRLDRGEDALRRDWRGYGTVYVNPPYGDGLAPFMRRMSAFGSSGVEIICLVPHRTDTAWYHDHIRTVRAKCEWRGRIQHMRGVAESSQLRLLGAVNDTLPVKRYDGIGQSAPFPSVILYWGERVSLFEAAFDGAGEVWVR